MLKHMRVASFDSPAEFQQASGAWLARAPRRNNLILTILRRTVKSAENTRGWLVSAHSGPEIALLQAPPHQQATISDGAVEAARWAARFLPPDLPGIVGPSAVADAFSSECARTSQRAHLHWE
jgi:hypothetical protein